MTIVSPLMIFSGSDREDCYYLQEYFWRKEYVTKHTFRSIMASAFFNRLAIIYSNHPVGRAVHLYRSNKKFTAKQLQYTPGVVGNRFPGWTNSSTNCYRDKREGSFWHRTILYTANGAQR